MSTLAPSTRATDSPKKRSVIDSVIKSTASDWQYVRQNLLAYYKSCEGDSVQVIERPELGEAFRFRGNESLPLYGWFNFKEGFTKKLVDSVLAEFGSELKDGAALADPFAGMATTLLGGALRGTPAVGIEVNPFFHWIGSCKLNAHKVDTDVARAVIRKILHPPAWTAIASDRWPLLTTFHKYYDPDVLSRLIQLRDSIRSEMMSMGNTLTLEVRTATEGLLLLGLASVLELGCQLEKKGRGLKRRRNPSAISPDMILDRLQQQWNLMLDDVQKLKVFEQSQPLGNPRLVHGSAIEHQFQRSSLGLVLCSPPYCNSFDYSEVYKLELWFFEFVRTYEQWQELRKTTLRSHTATSFRRGFVHDSLFPEPLQRLIQYLSSDPVRSHTWSDYGDLVRGYFDDMSQVMQNLSHGCRKGAKVIMVVGNSSYLALPVATDLLLAQISRHYGFRPVEIRVGRRLVTAGQQWKHADSESKRYLRESAVVLERT